MPFGLGLRKVPCHFAVQAHTVAGLRSDGSASEGVEVALRMRRGKKEYLTATAPGQGAGAGAGGVARIEAGLEMPCTLYAGKAGFEPKVFEVAVVFSDLQEPLVAQLDMAAYAREGTACVRTEAVALAPYGRVTLTVRSCPEGVDRDAHELKSAEGNHANGTLTGASDDSSAAATGGAGTVAGTAVPSAATGDRAAADADDASFEDDLDDLQPGGGGGSRESSTFSSGSGRAKRVEIGVVISSTGKELGRLRVRPTSKVSVLRKLVAKRVARLPQKFGFVHEGAYVTASREPKLLVSDILSPDGHVVIYDVFQG